MRQLLVDESVFREQSGAVRGRRERDVLFSFVVHGQRHAVLRTHPPLPPRLPPLQEMGRSPLYLHRMRLRHRRLPRRQNLRLVLREPRRGSRHNLRQRGLHLPLVPHPGLRHRHASGNRPPPVPKKSQLRFGWLQPEPEPAAAGRAWHAHEHESEDVKLGDFRPVPQRGDRGAGPLSPAALRLRRHRRLPGPPLRLRHVARGGKRRVREWA
mmetsp:Transcript_27097/g.47913  ORF Transcript_27097/g.47913 Transcript_27097/m.47913 type:complete len:211 (+) Transcript_27097:427-1059(+)